MTNSNYPSLLDKRARIFASLNRSELIVLAFTYLILSYLGLGGIKALLLNVVVLVLVKLINTKLERGFFELINSKTLYDWQGALGGKHEQ